MMHESHPFTFHLAFPVRDLDEAKRFYCDVLGCLVGRSAPNWIDFNFFGHQLSAHVKLAEVKKGLTSLVDGTEVPVRHFGIVLPYENWEALRNRLEKKNIHFLMKPQLRHKGQLGEQWTFFIQDPSGNAMEFKSLTYPESLFA